MSYLNSKFDIVSVDNPVALASLAQVLEVSGGMSVNANGTPVAGSIMPGMLVSMTNTGKAQLATGSDSPQLIFVTVDGNVDFSGSYVQKLTCLHGGVTVVTDQFEAGSYSPSEAVTCHAGKIAKRAGALADAQIVGFVGPAGQDSTNGTLQVILPQGAGL